MTFKEMVAEDIKNIFLSTEYFAHKRTLIFDGITYTDIPVVLEGVSEIPRVKNSKRDHSEGLYKQGTVLYAAYSDIGLLPEKGLRIRVNDREGGGGFFQEYYITEARLDEGMIRLELEELNE